MRILWLLVLAGCQSATVKPPVELSGNWCDRVTPGLAGVGSTAEVSRAHAAVRFFGPGANYATTDAALAAALQEGTLPDLAMYAAALPSLCSLQAAPAPSLPPARVELKGEVALIQPGSGSVTLPVGAKAVAIDLRNLPSLPELDQALQAAIAPALASPLVRSSLRVRRHDGMDDEVFAPGNNVYSTRLVTVDRAALAPSGSSELPLVLITGPKMAPGAAEWAGELRLRGRAALVGASVLASVAEADWSPIGAGGLMWRGRQLLLDGVRWPDEIAADIRSDDPESEIARARALKLTAIDFTQGTFDRPDFEQFALSEQPGTLDIGVVRAALYVFHGTVRLFYPYFPVVGDEIDQRLDEVLPAASADRGQAGALIRRFANALHDGHFFNNTLAAPAGYLPVSLDWYGDQPVVHRSLEPLVNAGDTIVRYAGMAVEDWYASQVPAISAATDGAVKLRAASLLTRLSGPTQLTLRDPLGATRDVTVQPQPQTSLADQRQNGFLDDLGAPDIYYFNLDSSVTNDPVTWNQQLADAHSATGMVLDMRGYPDTAHFVQLLNLLGEWIGKPWSRPIYTVPTYQGLDGYSFTPDPVDVVPAPFDAALAYSGPLVWLVGPYTQSAAEDFSIEIVSSGRIKKVVGRTSAGTDGNITGLFLPGGFSVSFTGMEVRFPDGKQFDAVGIVPDVVVPPNPADLAAGIDSDLVEAVKQIRN